jgi:hypothetical protein
MPALSQVEWEPHFHPPAQPRSSSEANHPDWHREMQGFLDFAARRSE